MDRFNTDYGALKKDIAESERTNSGSDRTKVNHWHKLKFGDNIFRFIPENDATWYHIERSHFIFDNFEKHRPVPCNYYKTNKKEKCDICKAFFALSEDERKTKRDLRVTTTYLLKAVDTDGQVGILAFNSVTVFQELTKLVQQTKDEFDMNVLADGALINIIKKKTGDRKMDVKYEVRLVQKPKKINGQTAMITKTEKLTEAILTEADALPKLSEIYPDYTKEEIAEMRDGKILDRFKTNTETETVVKGTADNDTVKVETNVTAADTTADHKPDQDDDEYVKILKGEM